MEKQRAHNLPNLVGLKFGRLTVLQRTRSDKHKKARWICRCDCGNQKTAGTTGLRRGSVASCGCLRRETAAEHARNLKPRPKQDWTTRATKHCPKCEEELPISEFGRNSRSYDGYQSYCKFHAVQVTHENTIKNWGNAKNYRLQYRHGITLEQYHQMLEDQDHKCAICQRYPEDNPKNPWHVDHDHKTGKIRGILCHACNTALGNFKDDPETLGNALKYLTRFSGEQHA